MYDLIDYGILYRFTFRQEADDYALMKRSQQLGESLLSDIPSISEYTGSKVYLEGECAELGKGWYWVRLVCPPTAEDEREFRAAYTELEPLCSECEEVSDERVYEGMKCGRCAYGIPNTVS